MTPRPNGVQGRDANVRRLLAYVADLELEVDRLRRHNHHIALEARSAVQHIQQASGRAGQANGQAPALEEIGTAARQLAQVLADLHEAPGYHPAHDQVVAIAVRPLAEQVFRWQQRLQRASDAVLVFELETDHVDWFPARLRHILNNLFSNALKYRDADKQQARVQLGLRSGPEGFELRVADNGIGMDYAKTQQAFDLFSRATPARAAGQGLGLAVARLLVEQSGGSLTVSSGEGEGSLFVVSLPSFEIDDFLI